MRSLCVPLTLILVLAAPGLLRAQQAPGSQPGPSNKQLGAPRAAIDAEKMYEDIEILRRILDRKLTPLYRSYSERGFGMVGGPMPGGGFGMAGGPTSVVTPLPSLEGVYLNGQGVVYTATLSSLALPAKDKPISARTSYLRYWEEAMAVSEWDNVRRQVRNEKDEPKKDEASKPPSLSDVLLKVLAENGHHFSQLGENEKLTIVITVREAKASPAAGQSPKGPGVPTYKAPQAPANPSVIADSSSSDRVRDREILGDLHLKQGRYEEALKRYMELPKQKHDAGYYRRLAQCYLGLEKYEDARHALDLAIKATSDPGDEKSKPADGKSKAELPVKVIISVHKRLLDVAKDGKMTFDEFRRRSSVETIRFGERKR